MAQTWKLNAQQKNQFSRLQHTGLFFRLETSICQTMSERQPQQVLIGEDVYDILLNCIEGVIYTTYVCFYLLGLAEGQCLICTACLQDFPINSSVSCFCIKKLASLIFSAFLELILLQRFSVSDTFLTLYLCLSSSPNASTNSWLVS